MNPSIQQKPFSIATLTGSADSSEEGKTVVEYHDLYWSSDIGRDVATSTSLPELPGAQFISNCEDLKDTQTKTTNPLIKSDLKTTQLSHTASHDAATFLSGKFPSLLCRKKKSTMQLPSSTAAVSVENAVFDLGRHDSPGSTFKSSQYHAFEFTFPESKGIKEYRQMLMIRQPGLQRSGTMSLSKDLGSFESFDVVEICTGMCLLSEPDLNLCTKNAGIQPKQLAVLPVSICEKEIIIRLSTTIANTAALYLHSHNTRSEALRINIDIPSVQYYMNALEAFDEGRCCQSDVLNWMAAIRHRRHLLFQAFSNAILYGLKARGLSEDRVTFALSSGLKAAGEVIFCKLRTGTGPNDWIGEIMRAIMGDSREFWPDFLNLLSDKDRTPKTWREFQTLSYVYEVAKPALRTRSSEKALSVINKNFSALSCTLSRESITVTKSAPPSPPPGRADSKSYFDPITDSSAVKTLRVLLLAVDDSDEGRIYIKANQALCRVSTSAARSPGVNACSNASAVISRILTIYPAPQVIIGTSNAKSDWSRPSLWRAPSPRGDTGIENILQFQNKIGNESKVETESDVLGRVYDEDLVRHLEGWLCKSC